MMLRLLVTITFLLSFVSPVWAARLFDFKASFVRENDLWLKLGDNEAKVTNGDYVQYRSGPVMGSGLLIKRGKCGGFHFIISRQKTQLPANNWKGSA